MHIKELVICTAAKCQLAGTFELIELKEEYAAAVQKATATICLANCPLKAFRDENAFQALLEGTSHSLRGGKDTKWANY